MVLLIVGKRAYNPHIFFYVTPIMSDDIGAISHAVDDDRAVLLVLHLPFLGIGVLPFGDYYTIVG